MKLDTNELKRHYLGESLSSVQIGQLCNCGTSTVLRALHKNGIPIRSFSEAAKLSTQYRKPSERKEQKRGPEHGNWKGGRYQHKEGYICIRAPNHERARSNGYVFEHILVWEKVHGEKLPEGWIIHHLNGIRSDNRPRNLIALPKGKHHNQLVNQALKQQIRELEEENKLLEKALDSNQMIFRISEN